MPKFIIIAFIIPLIVLESVTFGLDCLVQTYIMKSFWGIWPYVVIFVLGCIVGALGVKNMVQKHVNYYNNHIRLFIYEMLIPHIFLVLFLFFETMIIGLGYCFERFCLNIICVEIVLIILSVICIIIGIYKRDDGCWDLGFLGFFDPFLLIYLGAFFIIEIALFSFVGEQWYWIVGFVSLSIISIVVSYRLFIEYIEDGWLFNYIIDLER